MANLSQLVQEDDGSKRELIAIAKAIAEASDEVRMCGSKRELIAGAKVIAEASDEVRMCPSCHSVCKRMMGARGS